MACYTSAYVLYPHFLIRKRITAYLILVIAICLSADAGTSSPEMAVVVERFQESF